MYRDSPYFPSPTAFQRQIQKVERVPLEETIDRTVSRQWKFPNHSPVLDEGSYDCVKCPTHHSLRIGPGNVRAIWSILNLTNLLCQLATDKARVLGISS